MNVLIVEDNEYTTKQLTTLLTKEGFICSTASGARQAYKALEEDEYQILLVDWNLGDGDGLEFIRDLRFNHSFPTPILMLSANSEIEGKVQVLNAGADDYLCKPYSNIELLARIRALLRREKNEKSPVIKIENITLDTLLHEVKVNNEIINLTTSEYTILKALMENKNIVLTRHQLLDEILPPNTNIQNSNIIDVHIKNIRKKLDKQELIQTVRGVGYSIKI